MSRKTTTNKHKTSDSTANYPVSPHKNSKPIMTKKQSEMDPIRENLLCVAINHSRSQIDELSRNNSALIIAAYTTRRSMRNGLRDRARDDAYAELTMKLWQTKENRAIQERDDP